MRGEVLLVTADVPQPDHLVIAARNDRPSGENAFHALDFGRAIVMISY
jgi:hypothetical protein